MTEYKRRGPAPFAPTETQRRQVARYVGFGLTHPQIASVVLDPATDRPISVRTLQRHFRDELVTGIVAAVANVAGALYRQAMTGNVAAQIFFLKCRGHWKETAVIENWVGGIPGHPLEVKHSAKQLFDALDAMAERRRSIEGGLPGSPKPNGAHAPPAQNAGET